MSKWLALAKGGKENSETLTDTLQEAAKSPSASAPRPFLKVYEGCREEVGGKSSASVLEPASHCRQDCKHGFAAGGRPKTWTGKVVSLEEWRTLSAWRKHGPDGRVWNGRTKKWEVLK